MCARSHILHPAKLARIVGWVRDALLVRHLIGVVRLVAAIVALTCVHCVNVLLHYALLVLSEFGLLASRTFQVLLLSVPEHFFPLGFKSV